MKEPKDWKICHLTSAHRDGDIRIFYKECVSLAKAGFQTYLVIPNTGSRVEKGVNIVSFQSDEKSRRGRMIRTVNEVYRQALKVDADLYHFHDPELLRIATKLKRKGKKVIYDVHEDLPKQILGKYWINKSLRSTISKTFRRYENRIAKKLDGIITATSFIAERFHKINANTITINNFPFVDELNTAEATNHDAQKNAVCYVGGITKIRGISELIEAMSNCPDTKLLLAGPVSPENYLDELKQIKGWDKVVFFGKVDRKGVADILSKSIAGVVTFHPLPNHVDAQPNKMFEYMSAEIPVIGSHFPFWKAIIVEDESGLCVDPEDPVSIAAAINKLQKEPQLASEMGANGRAAVLNKYNWGIEEAKLIEFYQGLTDV